MLTYFIKEKSSRKFTELKRYVVTIFLYYPSLSHRNFDEGEISIHPSLHGDQKEVFLARGIFSFYIQKIFLKTVYI